MLDPLPGELWQPVEHFAFPSRVVVIVIGLRVTPYETTSMVNTVNDSVIVGARHESTNHASRKLICSIGEWPD